MVIGVLGGTGSVGREVAAELRRRGHRVVVLSRRAPAEGEHRRVDVTSGAGLATAMNGLDAVVDVVNGDAATLVDGVTRGLAVARAAGVAHWVTLSVVGAEHVPAGYYRAKVAQEAAVREGGVRWSIVRATQLHSFLGWAFAASARRGVLPSLRVPVQPVDTREVAAVLADRVEAGPSGEVEELGGPRVERLDDLARAWARTQGVRRLPVRVPVVGRTLRAVRAGALTDPAAPHGDVTFADWLREAA